MKAMKNMSGMSCHEAQQSAKEPVSGHRFALYARVSTDKQASEATIDSQLSLLCDRVQADGGQVEPALCFVDDGVSGANLVRPALERLRDQAAAGAIDRLYVLAPDRLARRHAHQMVLVEELQACGVEVVFVNRPLTATPEDQLLLQVQGMIAEYERAKILERTRRGRLHAARRGCVSALSHAPYGYRYLDKQAGGGAAAYEVNEDEARVVRQVFAWVAREGCSLREVVRRLEKQGVRSYRGHERWEPSTITTMLKNPAYRGQAAYGKTGPAERRRLRPRRGQVQPPRTPHGRERRPLSQQIFIPVPALVDHDLFAAAQERLEENRRRLRERRPGPRHFLQGLAVCGLCGYAICGNGRSDCDGRPAKHAYYRCTGRDGSRSGGRPLCDNPTQSTKELDAAVWQDVCLLLQEPQRLREEFVRRQQGVKPDTADNERLRRTIAKVKQGISRLIDAYAAGLLETSEFEPRIKQLKDRLAKLEQELQSLTQQAQQEEELRLVFNRLQDFAEQIEESLASADWEQRRDILRTLVKRVEVGKDNITIVYKVPHRPFARGPQRGRSQHCSWRQRNAFLE